MTTRLTTLLALLSLIACTKSPPASTAEIGAARAVAPSPAAPLLAIEAGGEYTCAIRFGALICWGSNDALQIGAPPSDSVERHNPPRRIIDAGVTAVAAGERHTCAIVAGAVKCWGELDHHHSGAISVSDARTFIDAGATAIAAGSEHTCAIHSGGALKCWGDNRRLQLGHPERKTTAHTVFDSGVTALSAGDHHTCAIHNGALKCWGENSDGQLGKRPAGERDAQAPHTVFNSGVTAVAAGDDHTCAIRSGEVKCWGSAGLYQTDAILAQPISGATAIAAGRLHTCAILSGGALKCWGFNGEGQLGAPVLHPPPDGPHTAHTVFSSGVTAVAAGDGHTCAIHRGDIKCWGSNSAGQLAAPDTAVHATPQQLTALTRTTQLTAGDGTCAIDDGAARCWGSGAQHDLRRPDGLAAATIAPRATAAAAGFGHACAVVDGALQCTGPRAWEVAGVKRRDDPAQRHTILADGVTAISARSTHLCAIQRGALKCMGVNRSGQVRLPKSPSTPPHTAFKAGVTAVAVGGEHTCAIHEGALKCWGSNTHEQLDRKAADVVAPLTLLARDVTAITAAEHSTCGLSGGNLTCWGRDLTPKPSTSHIKAIGAGYNHTCAIHGEGELTCWGSNSDGQLGTPSREATAHTVFDSGVTALAVGAFHTCAVHLSAVKCWGANSNNQLGFSYIYLAPQTVPLTEL